MLNFKCGAKETRASRKERSNFHPELANAIAPACLSCQHVFIVQTIWAILLGHMSGSNFKKKHTYQSLSRWWEGAESPLSKQDLPGNGFQLFFDLMCHLCRGVASHLVHLFQLHRRQKAVSVSVVHLHVRLCNSKVHTGLRQYCKTKLTSQTVMAQWERQE